MSTGEAPPSPSSNLPNTTQQELYKWMKKFVTLYNENCDKVHIDPETYRRAADSAVVDTIEEVRYQGAIPLYYFVVKVMEKTWRSQNPLSPLREFALVFAAPDDSQHNRREYQVLYAPPFLKCDHMMKAILAMPSAIDALRLVVLGNLETQFHTRIADFKRPRGHFLEQRHQTEYEQQQTAFEKELAAMKRALPRDVFR